MQALHIRLRTDPVVLSAWFVLNVFAFFIIATSAWIATVKVIVLICMIVACTSGGWDLLLQKPDSIVAIRNTGQRWVLRFRSGALRECELVSTWILGDWVWMQFRPRRYRRKLVLLTPQNTDSNSLRRLRVMLRS